MFIIAESVHIRSHSYTKHDSYTYLQIHITTENRSLVTIPQASYTSHINRYNQQYDSEVKYAHTANIEFDVHTVNFEVAVPGTEE